jgi:hypothetical protein
MKHRFAAAARHGPAPRRVFTSETNARSLPAVGIFVKAHKAREVRGIAARVASERLLNTGLRVQKTFH